MKPMGELSLPGLVHFILFLAFPIMGGYAATRLKLQPIIGYIVGGIVLRLYLGEQIASTMLSEFASIGIILLLFFVGLEANLGTLRRFGKFVVIGGAVQMVVSAVALFMLSLLFGFSAIEAVFIGVAFALSSTAVVAKLIQDRGVENSLVGGLVIGILVMQDLVVIPLMVVLPAMGGGGGGVGATVVQIVASMLRAGFILGLVYVLGRNIVPYIFNKIARGSRELLNLFTIFFIMSSVLVFSGLGLAPSIAAFISGVLIGQTLQHYHVFSQIRPLRDLFAILFFVFLGASVELGVVAGAIGRIVIFTVFLMLIKFLVVLVSFVVFRFHSRTAFSMGLFLFQVGEFAFIIMHQGFEMGVVSPATYMFAITSVLLTIVATPLLVSNKDRAYVWIRDVTKKRLPVVEQFISHKIDRSPPHIGALKMRKHVIICGYGRVGSYVGRALDMARVPFIAIDYDFRKVEAARARSIHAIYGDPTNIDILDYAECEHAIALVSAVPERFAQEMIILNAKRLKPRIAIFTRISREGDQRRMRDLGAEVVVQPEFEAALAIVRKIFAGLHIPREELVGKIRRLKIEHGMA